VADGNGRLARLLTAHELLAQGYRVVRYISIEQRVYESKNAYYNALYESQRHWHEGDHSVWPWSAYFAEILGSAYDDLERQVSTARSQTGNKQARVREYVLEHAPRAFRRRDIERALPGISDATVRLVLAELREEGRIESKGAGRGARWQRLQDD
jgi:Fic family protein